MSASAVAVLPLAPSTRLGIDSHTALCGLLFRQSPGCFPSSDTRAYATLRASSGTSLGLTLLEGRRWPLVLQLGTQYLRVCAGLYSRYSIVYCRNNLPTPPPYTLFLSSSACTALQIHPTVSLVRQTHELGSGCAECQSYLQSAHAQHLLR